MSERPGYYSGRLGYAQKRCKDKSFEDRECSRGNKDLLGLLTLNQ